MGRKARKAEQSGGAGDGGRARADVQVSGWSSKVPRPRWRPFPGPAHLGDALRLTFTRRAYAELVTHTKDQLDVEVCGVLVGEFCEDDDGLYVQVHAIIRGTAARQGGAHVTYTQETWREVHQRMEAEYPKYQIVGWYHSHPGFGVDFSDMDLFIQKNFFASPGQIALVSDPLGGDEAVCANGPEGIIYLSRFWIDGRERRCKLPATGRAGGADATDGPHAAKALATVEARLSQLIRAVENQRVLWHRTLLVVGTVAALGIIAAVVYSIFDRYTSRFRPPRLRSFAPVPVKVGDDTVMLGVSIVSWDVPPELNAAYIELERQKREEEAAATQPAAGRPEANGARPAPPGEVDSHQPATAGQPEEPASDER